jgi:predicted NBD/HSP70 family sugar kinase
MVSFDIAPARPRHLGAVDVLRVIRDAGSITRSELIARTGLARSTISQRVEALMAHELVLADGENRSTGGRPPSRVAFNPRAGLVFAADLGVTHSSVALTDLGGEILAERREEIHIASGPEPVLAWVEEQCNALLAATDEPADRIRAIGVGVPGPVEFANGRPVSPPIMPGWDGFPIPERLQRRHPVPVLVDNDVNIMALGEHRASRPDAGNLVFIKVGTGIGCGIVAGRRIYRGAQGAAGDIGHIRLAGHADVICECGNRGCLEAVASGRALARTARALGLDTWTSLDLVEAVLGRQPDAVHLVRQAGRDLGEVLAGLVNAFNPELIIVGGDMAGAQEQLFAGIREIVYQRSTPLATHHLQIVRSELGDRAGTTGAAVMAIERALEPDIVEALLSGPAPRALAGAS